MFKYKNLIFILLPCFMMTGCTVYKVYKHYKNSSNDKQNQLEVTKSGDIIKRMPEIDKKLVTQSH
jgi:hypothetical protein